jgi:hypothetical protein
VQDGTCALVLEAPFTSISATTEANSTLSLGDQFLSSGAWDNFRRMQGHTRPIFGMVGELDSSFPPDDVQRLVETTSGRSDLWLVAGARHGVSNGGVPEVAGLTTYLDRIRDFLGEAGCL